MWERLANFASNVVPEAAGAPPKDIYNLMVQMRIPFKKDQTPTYIGNTVVFLASDDSSYVTGCELPVSGGLGQI